MIDVELRTRALARELASRSADPASTVFALNFWNDKLLDRAMSQSRFRTRLFQLVDVLPSTAGADDVAAHVGEYLGDDAAPRYMRALVAAARRLPGGARITERVAKSNVERMAQQFIAGTDAGAAVEAMSLLWSRGRAHTVDILGEKTLVPSDADRYALRVHDLVTALLDAAARWDRQPELESDDIGSLPRVNVSVKPTALATHFDPLGADHGIADAKRRLEPTLDLALARGAHVFFDMEHADVKDTTLRLAREVLDDPRYADLHAGVVIQAYRRDSRDDLGEVIAWSAQRPTPVSVRLVKGAYWDTETIEAEARGWPSPVYLDKEETDANFERCVRLLHDHHGAVRAAFGSHNLRSVAYAIEYARGKGIPDNGYELQLLHGMAPQLEAALVEKGFRVRVYSPVGELVPGMAYLVRRLLENTSNESFLRHRYVDGDDLDELLARPKAIVLTAAPAPVDRADTDPDDPAPYEPEPTREWRRVEVQDAFGAAVERVAAQDVPHIPAFIDGVEEQGAGITRRDPADPERIVSVSASCDAASADRALAAAVRAASSWRDRPASERAGLLFRTAAELRARRDDIAALQVFEAGKPWAEADADVCEAIDFCEYYGREALRLDTGGEVQSPPGERNVLRYRGKGPTVVIAPWNFPLAIPTGMTVAAIAAGNPTILKPAEQTPAVAWALVEALRAAGAPSGVIQFMPGPGETVGARLVAHADTAVIAFTGSLEVGLQINQMAAVPAPGQRHVKRVIAEMGGKNALIVDADADPDQAVPGAVASAFGFSGQKCSAASRLLVHTDIYDDFVARLTEAVADLRMGHPRDRSVHVGPLIDDEALAKVRRYVEVARREGTILAGDVATGTPGVIAPVVVADLDDDARVLCDEIFGPVLAVRRVADLDEAIRVANDTPYALTAGIYSRTPSHIDRAARELRAGNIYVNRSTTGAVVGRQAFGGYGLSGVGSKAGGPDYLRQFTDPWVVTENLMRQGFAAAD